MASPEQYGKELQEALYQAPVFRVPYPLRNQSELMFIPHVVSIGPLHNPLFGRPPAHPAPLAVPTLHGSASFGRHRNVNNQQFSLLEMERYKQIAVKTLSDQLCFTDLVSFLKSKEHEMFSFYDRKLMQECFNIDHNSVTDQGALQEFAHLVAVDACFIACFLQCLYDLSSHCLSEKLHIPDGASVTPKISYPSTFQRFYLDKLSRPIRKAILQDLLLVENQIPLFAIKEVIRADKRCGSESEAERRLDMYLASLTLALLPFSKSNDYVLRSVKHVSRTGHHLLDCMYSIVCAEDPSLDLQNPMAGFIVDGHDLHHEVKKISNSGFADRNSSHPCSSEPEDYRLHLPELNPEGVPGAKELYLSGVTLHGHGGSLKEISFDKGKLSIPKIHVGDDTEKIFRNLIAYETCFKVGKVDILSYVHFMDFLVDTPQDVELLKKQQVITESLGSSERVAEMWNKLCRNTYCMFSHKYKGVSKQATAYCNSRLQGMWAEFYRSNLSRPWLVVPVLSGAALLIMTFVIMWFTLLLYWNERVKRG